MLNLFKSALTARYARLRYTIITMQTEIPTRRIALSQLGFRPFFLVTSLFAIIAISLWFSITAFNTHPVAMTQLAPVIWHAHEMIYGYAIAVIAGFLLTAVRNWTGVPTLNGLPLMMLVLLWGLARLMPFSDHALALPMMAALDLTFNLGLCLAILHPIIKGKHHKSLGVWLKLVALMASNLLFYLGLYGVLSNGVQLGLYSGLYLIISFILLLGRRVIPMFIRNGVGYPVTLTNRRWLDISCLLLLLIFIVTQVFLPLPALAALCAGLLCLLHAIRLAGWHTAGIWKKPLLWILYLAYGWITIGFGVTAAAYLFDFNHKLALHAFAYGGIGLITLGMMARVALGHTGRDVSQPPAILGWVFTAILTGSVLRVLLPVIIPQWHAMWIAGSQLLWIVAFILFISVFAPMLVRPRIDGKPG